MVQTGPSSRSANIISQKDHTDQHPAHKSKQQYQGPSTPFLDAHPSTRQMGKGSEQHLSLLLLWLGWVVCSEIRSHCNVDQSGLELRDPSASASWMLGLKEVRWHCAWFGFLSTLLVGCLLGWLVGCLLGLVWFFSIEFIYVFIYFSFSTQGFPM